MPNDYRRRTTKEDRSYRRGWKRVTAFLAPVVVLTTVSTLILPAITMSKEQCPLTEHQHDAACYAVNEAVSLACDYDALGVHEHAEACFDEEDALICDLPDFIVHTHDSRCYQDDALVCELPEIAEHQHTEECYRPVAAVEVHRHTDDCYEWTDGVCTLEGTEDHAHDENCGFKTRGELICGLEETEDTAENAEPELICGKEEIILHTHEDSCYIMESEIDENTEAWILELVRQQKKAELESEDNSETEPAAEPQEDSETEPVTEPEEQEGTDEEQEDRAYLICALPEIFEHQHEDACFVEGEPDLICQIPEHIHTPDCIKIDASAEGTEGEPDEEPQPLTEEEQAAAANVNALIDGLPTVDAIKSDLVTKTEEEYFTYKDEVTARLEEAIGAYRVLSEAQKALILHYNKVTELEVYLKGETGEDTEAELDLEFVADSYTTTVTAPGEANLPADTVVTATPLFDSNEPMVTAFSLFAEPEETPAADGSAYVDDIMAAVTWGDVTRIKLFDISLTSGDEEVQPAVPVIVRTEFAEPLMIEAGEAIYGVHIGEDGVEILPAETERDEDGNIIAVTHTQSSFSPSGYTLVHVTNPTDIGEDVLPVHYCLWVNEQWTVVGSTRTGWYGNYTETDALSTKSPDYITVDQMRSILGEYGFPPAEADGEAFKDIDAINNEIWRTIWYQRAETPGTICHNTKPEQKEIDGELVWVFPLAGNKRKTDGYHIYYVPGGTKSGKEKETTSTYTSNDLLANDLKNESKFYTFTVRDMNKIVYKDGMEDQIPAARIVKYKTPVSVTVKANLDSEGKSLGWMWVNDKGDVVHGIDRLWDENHNGVFEDKEGDSRFTYVLNEGTKEETYGFGSEENGTGILGRTTLIPYSVAVDGAKQSTAKQVDIAVYLDGKWQKVGQLNLMYQRDDLCVPEGGKPHWFVTEGQVYTILKDFGFEPSMHADSVGHLLAHAHGLFSETAEMTMHVDGVNDELENSVAIGLSADSKETAFTLFYIPGIESTDYDKVQGMTSQGFAGSELLKNSRFYSIKVSDPYQIIYYGSETDNFIVYAQEGKSVTVNVETGSEVLWTVQGKADYASSNVPGTKFDAYTFTNISESPVSIVASYQTPSYTVQYYSWIPRYQYATKSSDSTLPVINTSDGHGLPTNTTMKPNHTNSLKYLQLVELEEYTDQNASKQTKLNQVKTEMKLTRIYKEKLFSFDRTYEMSQLDKLKDNASYVIKQVRVLRDGGDPTSDEWANWWIYNTSDDGKSIRFTNKASEEYAPREDNEDGAAAGVDYTILITEGMVIRLCYQSLEAPQYNNNNISFYDYDISSNGTDIGQAGINSIYAGYTISNNLYAFGNVNCYTGMGAGYWTDSDKFVSQPNQFNEKVYSKCTFGLVTGLDDAGNLEWNNIEHPEIFGGVAPEGRMDYTGTLTFNRIGDVFTLTAAEVRKMPAGNVAAIDETEVDAESNNIVGGRNDLELLFHPNYGTGSAMDIYTNNFWIMDGATGQKDPLWGMYGNTGKVNGNASDPAKPNTKWQTNVSMPYGDDGRAHNWFFGMTFEIEFSVSADYVGPLEYLFFGDDDMWVFLEKVRDPNQKNERAYEEPVLICDIGGVHSAVGELVDLRDYLPAEEFSAGTYKLKFFYTERGASGSTCWMSFTLPSVTSVIEEAGNASITLTKKVENVAGESVPTDEEFEFTVDVYTDDTMQERINETTLTCDLWNTDGTWSYPQMQVGGTISIRAGETLVIHGAPIGSYYCITETDDNRYSIEVNGDKTNIAKGYVKENDSTFLNFVNIQKAYRLPNTGGPGDFLYFFSGSVLVGAVLLMLGKQRKSSRRGVK